MRFLWLGFRIGGFWIGLIAFAAGMASCASAPPPSDGAEVVVSFSIWGSAARDLVGDRLPVRVLAGPGADVHTYAPTPDDAKAVSRARLLVRHGLQLDNWMTSLKDSTGSKAPMVEVSRGVPVRRGFGEDSHAVDPHLWQDPQRAVLCVSNLALALAAMDPLGASVYQSRFEAWRDRALSLHREIRERIQGVPASKRRVITTHDAFGYYGEAFGVEFLAPMGLSTEKEPSAQAVAQLVDQMKREKIRAVFLETRIDPRLVTSLARDAGGFLGGELFPDTLSPPEGPAPDYFSMVRHNSDLLIAGMQGN